jgi:outer membrane protein assembly factor BamB
MPRALSTRTARALRSPGAAFKYVARHRLPTGAALITALLLTASPHAENWPQWRGPSQNGVSGETGLPVRWSKTENIAWKLALPAWSGSTPIVWGDRVFLSVASGSDLFLWAIDRSTGSTRWTARLGGGNQRMQKQNMSSPSPVTDGRYVWVLTGTGILKAFDFDGKELWGRDLQKEYGRFGLNWGYGSSPLLYDDSLYVQVVHGMHTQAASYVLRIDKATGRTVWKIERPTSARYESKDSYATPALVRLGSTNEIVVSGADVVTGYEPATGRELWRAEGLNPDRDGSARVVASPTVVGDLIVAPSRERPLIAVRAGGRGDVTRSHVVWTLNDGTDVPTPVSDGTLLYLINDRGIMSAIDVKSGKAVYGRQRLPSSTYSGSPVLADGKIYITNEDGMTSVVKAGPTFEILSRNNLDEYTLSSPAVSEGQIFIRTEAFLYCIGQRARTAKGN